MPSLDKDILIKNIKQLMKVHNITQPQLAKDLNVSQPSISKCLTGKQSISIDLVYCIAHYFKVSLDDLCKDYSTPTSLETANENASETKLISAYDICKCLAFIFKSALPYTKTITHKETAYIELTDDYGDGTGTFYGVEKENFYTSIFFSNYFKLDYHPESREDHDEYMDNLQQYGNIDEQKVAINTFISQLEDLLVVFKKGSMTYESYTQTIDANLAMISKNN